MTAMTLVRSIADARRALAPRRVGRLGFVPTMGALHEGHVSLFRLARAECTAVAASIFVNPTQFNDPADLAAYPRPESRDAEMAESAGVDVLFVPSAGEIYPPARATAIDAGGLALGYEGADRPGHFAGVALVCVKLFNIVGPHVVYLGQKDAQQVAVLHQTLRDLDMPIEIRVCPTLRDPDGLAMSSRNVRLSPEERGRALAIPRALIAGLTAYRRGEDPSAAARIALGDLDADYVEVADFSEPTLVIAARVGKTRLIDNVPLDRPALAGLP